MCKDTCLTTRNKCIGNLVFLGLIAALAFNIAVAASCEYLNGPGNLQLGIFRYALDLPGSKFDTAGECVGYDAELDKPAIKTSKACAILAPVFGFLTLAWMAVNQFCCPVPCSNLLIGLFFFGAQVCTILVWFVYVNEVCIAVEIPADGIIEDVVQDVDVDTTCEFSTTAYCNLLASIMYFVAWLLTFLLPTPKEAQLARMVDSAERRALVAEERATEAEGKVAKMQSKNDKEP